MRPRLWGVALVAEAKRMLASPTCFNEAPAVPGRGLVRGGGGLAGIFREVRGKRGHVLLAFAGFPRAAEPQVLLSTMSNSVASASPVFDATAPLAPGWRPHMILHD